MLDIVSASSSARPYRPLVPFRQAAGWPVASGGSSSCFSSSMRSPSRLSDRADRTLMLPLDVDILINITAVTALSAAFFMAMAHGRPDAEDDG
jgi:hypothetical protein